MDTFLMNPADNVLLAVADLAPGHVTYVGLEAVTLPGPVASGHKLARRAIASGELVIKYGQPVGRAIGAIAAGEHVHVHNVESLRGRGDLDPQTALAVAAYAAARTDASGHKLIPAGAISATHFMGYRRRDGRAGVRNHVLVLSAVQCANGATRRIGKLVPEVVALPHVYGCSQLGDDLAQTQRTLEGFADHPNVAACVVVGLGCESLNTVRMAERLAEAGVVVERLGIQEIGGTGATAERGAAIAREMLSDAARAQREMIPLSELMVGLECGGSDAWSGITANPALGVASDLLVGAGGTALLSETTEFIGAEHLLAARAVSPDLARQINEWVQRWEMEARRMGVDMRGAQPTPGNIAGGLTTIEEKSLGAITKGGSSPVRELVAYACRPSRRGLVLMDTPGNDPESVTGMVAGGAQVVVFTTGRGSPAGCPIAPVIKVATNSDMYHRMADDMDVNAGVVLQESTLYSSEGGPLQRVGESIFEEIVAVASGKLTAAERWGNAEFSINMIGPRI